MIVGKLCTDTTASHPENRMMIKLFIVISFVWVRIAYPQIHLENMDFPSRLAIHPPNVPPVPKPSTNIPILAAVETSDQNRIENTIAKTKNIIASPSRFFPDPVLLSPLFTIE